MPESTLPLVIKAAEERGLPAYLQEHKEQVRADLLKHGAILFRNFDLKTIADFEAASGLFSTELLEYVYRSSPRTEVGAKVFTATEYPPIATIPLHNENAFQRDWPMKIMFFCVTSPKTGGETTLGDCRKVTRRIRPEIFAEFSEKKVMYVRNYGSGIDLPWENVFQTKDKAVVETFCAKHDIAFEWNEDGGLRTRQVCQGVSRHPVTGETLWFNQAHLFHVSSLDAPTHEALLEIFTEEELPRNAYFGDGSKIDLSVLQEIREAYEGEVVRFPWEAGDFLLVDNMLTAHGRSPFTGDRKILVSMAQPRSTLL